MLPGIALVYLFGNQGLLRELLYDNIYGFWGIVLGEAIYTFPHALMILLSALALADARLFDAAASMGASPWKAFRSITWPGSRQGVFAAFCLVFTLTITDFGVPVVIGGDYQVLALEAYKAVVGQQQFGRGALIGMVFLLPALFSFARRCLVAPSSARRHERARPGVPARAIAARATACYLAIVLLISAVLLLVFGMAVYSSLVKFWPYNLSLSLNHYQFNETAGGGWLAYRNSLKMALGTALIGSLLIFTGAYLMEKTKGQDGSEPGPAHAQLRADGGARSGAGPGLRVLLQPDRQPAGRALRDHDAADRLHHCSLFDHRANDRHHRAAPTRCRVRSRRAVARGAAVPALPARDRADLPAGAAGHRRATCSSRR